MIRLTPTGWAFLGGSVLLYLAALSSQSGLLLLLVGILLGAFLVNGVSAGRVVRKLDVAAPPVVRVCEGERTSQPWRISYHGRGDAGFIQAWSDAGLLFSLRHLPAGSPTTLAPDLVYAKRGVYPHAALRLTCSYPFGLVRAYRRVDLSGEVIWIASICWASSVKDWLGTIFSCRWVTSCSGGCAWLVGAVGFN